VVVVVQELLARQQWVVLVRPHQSQVHLSQEQVEQEVVVALQTLEEQVVEEQEHIVVFLQ
jgi:hypothetical protein